MDKLLKVFSLVKAALRKTFKVKERNFLASVPTAAGCTAELMC